MRATENDDGTLSSTSSSTPLDEAEEQLLRDIAAAPPRRPPSTAVAGSKWGEGGRYIIEATVGRGGMGTVYAASDTILARRVALKVLDATDLDQDAVARRRVLREARLAASVEHDRVARIYDVGTHEGVDFVAMELVRGVTLRHRARERRLSTDEIVTIVTQIAEGLRELHASGVVHRDLKPDNVMLTESGGVKLLDFGLARALRLPDASSGTSITTTGRNRLADIESLHATSGTPGYMAPEQCAGHPIDARADVFALGVIAYELVTGTRLFQGKDAESIMRATCAVTPDFEDASWKRVPTSLHMLTRRMLARAPKDRPENGAMVLAAMQGPARVGVNSSDYPRARRRRTLVLLLAIGLTALGIATFFVGRRLVRDAARARALAAPPPTGMVIVTGGTMNMGASVEEVDAQCREIGASCDRARLSWSIPPRVVTVAPFYLDIREVTNTEMVDLLNGLRGSLLVVPDEESHLPRYVRFNANLGQEPLVLVDLFDATTGVEYAPNVVGKTETYRTKSGRERWPVTQVTLFGARRFCAARGKRLPTEDEWEAAARGVEDRKYPWGNAPVRCGGVRVASDGSLESEPSCPPTPTPADVASSAQDVTPDGVFDLGGNVGEWTDTVFSLGTTPNSASGDELRPYATRGGSFATALGARTRVRGRQPPTAAGINGGFRCALSLAVP